MDLKISEVTRRDVVDSLLLRSSPFHGRLDLISFLKRVFNLQSMSSTDYRYKTAVGDIWKHLVMNDDWDYTYLLLTYLDLLTVPDSVFGTFLEQCVHPLVISDEGEARTVAAELSRLLDNDGFSLHEHGSVSGKPLFKLKATTASVEHRFEIALSFAGENREYVEQVASVLHTAGVEIFYDEYEKVTLWGKDLVEHLDFVYRGGARHCLMFISAAYAEKVWPIHERRSAMAYALEQRVEYILPVRFDDTPIPGLRPTVGYLDARNISSMELAELVMAKLGRTKRDD